MALSKTSLRTTAIDYSCSRVHLLSLFGHHFEAYISEGGVSRLAFRLHFLHCSALTQLRLSSARTDQPTIFERIVRVYNLLLEQYLFQT